mmetsp:Transcript_11090/g.19877  ORF Transcript_11090/g.19877 Transcript_11090/m.19877 type:complete len:284 (-) Transcript_11090:717-1568(-)
MWSLRRAAGGGAAAATGGGADSVLARPGQLEPQVRLPATHQVGELRLLVPKEHGELRRGQVPELDAQAWGHIRLGHRKLKPLPPDREGGAGGDLSRRRLRQEGEPHLRGALLLPAASDHPLHDPDIQSGLQPKALGSAAKQQSRLWGAAATGAGAGKVRPGDLGLPLPQLPQLDGGHGDRRASGVRGHGHGHGHPHRVRQGWGVVDLNVQVVLGDPTAGGKLDWELELQRPLSLVRADLRVEHLVDGRTDTERQHEGVVDEPRKVPLLFDDDIHAGPIHGSVL